MFDHINKSNINRLNKCDSTMSQTDRLAFSPNDYLKKDKPKLLQDAFNTSIQSYLFQYLFQAHVTVRVVCEQVVCVLQFKRM